MSLLYINAILGIGFGRQAFEVYGGDGSSTNPWRATALGDPSNQVRLVDTEANNTYTIFPLDTPGSPPTGYSPTGDLVRVTPNNHQYDTFPTPPTGTLNLGTNFEAITWVWGASSQLDPDGVFALCYVVGKNGKPDRWFFAVPDELELLTPNPLFA